MKPAPIPPNEAARLSALRQLGILDSPPEEQFDRLVEFLSQELQVPIALVSLVDEERQWFKANVGMDGHEAPRDTSFCGHAVAANDFLLVEDAAKDIRFSDNPLVTGHPHIRFYAGIPLHAPTGECIGTLCAIGKEPRKLSRIERAVFNALRDLANKALVAREAVT